MTNIIYDLIIIGGGPGGITAGIYAARQKLNILLITKDFGGQIARKSVDIENYTGFEKISGPELTQKFEKQLKTQKIEIVTGEVGKIEKRGGNFSVSTNSGKYEAKSVIIASGSDPRPLEVPGEKEFTGKGVSYCPLCDGPIFKDKIVAVIGGGNAGFEAAFFLANYVKKIYILEYGPQVKADAENQELVKNTEKAIVIVNATVEKIEGDGFVKSLTYRDLVSKELKKIEVDGIFVEIGNQPATSFAKNLVEFNEKDEIKVEFETYQTKTPGLFAVGDCNVGKYKQIITAAGEGAKAALAAYEYIKKNQN